ncbi:zinc finger protein 862-like [Rhizophagus clarus]|uniref:Zinc finger protein 862-like n=1 Tax=Rhizophagus clarus TaxID=94130 RepID=A0A8H3QIM5_9GLOM|nr:zinc finger protein 862-like [Rhizophagus clarus]
MSIKQYFKPKISSKNTDKINDYNSSNIDSDLKETHIELPNVNKNQAQKNLNFKKKKTRLILKKKKTEGFQKEWLKIYKWLVYDKSKNLMFCSLCQSHRKLNKFEKKGSKNFKTSALSEHASTKDHTDATNLEIARAELIKVSNNSVDKAQNHISALMKIIFWMAENNISLNKLFEIVKLCKILECPQLISVSNTITYENNVSGYEMLSVISNSIEKTIWKELNKAIAFGIMVDKSIDISCEPHLVIYVKYCLHRKIKIYFLKLLQLKSLTNKLMSFASDRASVMLGKSIGVASRIKERNECLFITHCIAYRLALVCNTAEKKVDFCKHIEYIIKSTYSFFFNSSKRIDTLHKYQKILEHPILKIKQIFEKLLAFLHFLWDILDYLATLSKIFQQKKIQISNIDSIIELTLRKIQQEFLDHNEDGRLLLEENLNRFLSNTTANDNYNISVYQLTWNKNYEADLIVDISSFASTVITEIQERFPDRSLLNSMKIFDHANWPNGREELIKYGEKELNILSEFYKKEVSNISEEWFGYKAIVHSNFKNIKIEVLLLRLFEFYYDTFPNIIKLLGIIYFIPFSSVNYECEFLK